MHQLILGLKSRNVLILLIYTANESNEMKSSTNISASTCIKCIKAHNL